MGAETQDIALANEPGRAIPPPYVSPPLASASAASTGSSTGALDVAAQAGPLPEANEAENRVEDARTARRASFMLAEIELAEGARDRALARLEALLAAPEPALAWNAATLLARSMPSAADSAAAWQRYLATAPRSPYRERAMLERADALLDAHRPDEARAVLAGVARSPLLPAQASQLERLLFKARELR
jgi:hypothetical protein